MYVEKKATGDLKLNEQFIHLGGERYSKGNEPKYTTQCPWPWLEPAQKKNPKQTRVLIGLKPCFYKHRTRALDVMMAEATRIYILMIKVNKLIFFFTSLYFLKEIDNMCSVFLRSYRDTHERVWESLKKLWKHLPVACVPTAFFVLQNFHLCFYNLIETWYMFYIS